MTRARYPRLHRLGAGGNREAFLEKRRKLRFTHALSPACQRRAVKWQTMLEELLPAEELVIGILDPAITQRLIAQVVHGFEQR
jgi:hypothetical protein